MKCTIITRRRGIKLTQQEICVRKMDSEESALRAYPQIRTYERHVSHSGKIKYYSPAAIKWYNSRNINDDFKTIYLTD